MSFLDCVMKADEIPAERKKGIEKRFNELRDEYIRRGGSADAASRAAQHIATMESNEALKRAENRIRAANAEMGFAKQAEARLADKLKGWQSGIGNSKISKFIFLKPSISREIDDLIIMTENLSDGYRVRAMDQMRDFMSLYKPDIFGRVSDEVKGNINQAIKASTGEVVEASAIQQAGKQLRKVLDWLEDEYIASGGVMTKMKNWLPQIHDSSALRVAGLQNWKNAIRNRIDWERVVDDVGYPIPENRREAFLDECYETLSTDGLNKVSRAARKGEAIQGSGGMASRRGHHRVLHFKSVDDQLAYNSEFGTDDMFMAIQNHIQSMSRDISIMRNISPDPDSFIQGINNRYAKEGGITPFSQKMYKVLVGRTAMTGSESAAYKSLKGMMNYLRACQLGSAVVPAISDAYWQKSARDLAGIHGSVINDYFKSGISKEEANLQVYAFEATTGNLLHRFMEDESYLTKGKTKSDKFMAATQNLSGLTMRVSGLQGFTSMGKDAITIGGFGQTAINRKFGWDELPADYRDFISTHGGINASDWKIIQKAKPTVMEGRGVEMLFPSDIPDLNVAVKYEAVIQRLRKLATNEPDIKTKAVTTMGAESGTFGRAMADMAFMYRSFPITVLNNHIRARLTKAYLNGGGFDSGMELGAMLALTTGLGYFTLNLKDIINNREPRVVSKGVTPEDMQMGAIQGGGFSVFGDFVLQDLNRFGGTLADTVMGPVPSFANDVIKWGRGHAMDAMFGEELWNTNEYGNWAEKFGLNTVKMVQRYTPWSSWWFARGALDQTVYDAAEKYAGGSEYYRAKAREQRQMQKLEQVKLIE